MVMNEWLPSFLFHVNRPSHSWDKVIPNWPWNSKVKVMGVVKGQCHSQSSIPLIRFLFIPHQSDQQILRYSYFKIWSWNTQGQDHEWCQRSRSHIIPSIQPMHFLFVSHQSDQPFLRSYSVLDILLLPITIIMQECSQALKTCKRL